jgi:hypothetical protein
LGNLNPILLNNTSSGVSSFQLPNGPKDDSYKMQIYVEIIDDSDGLTQFRIQNNIIVQPNDQLINNLSNDLLNSTSSSLINNLKNGDLQSTTSFISSFTSMLDSSTSSNSPNSTNSTNNVVILIKLIFLN